MTNLDRLNELLKAQNIPDFRKTVSPSLNNLAWLRKALNAPEGSELRALLDMNPRTIHQPYDATAFRTEASC